MEFQFKSADFTPKRLPVSERGQVMSYRQNGHFLHLTLPWSIGRYTTSHCLFCLPGQGEVKDPMQGVNVQPVGESG